MKSRQISGLQRLVKEQDGEICHLKTTNLLQQKSIQIAQELIEKMKNCQNCKYGKGEFNRVAGAFMSYKICDSCNDTHNKWALKE